jgi:short-subunit dehydrogenase
LNVLAGEHGDATLLVNAAGLFLPKPFLDHDGADDDSYSELDRAIFFLSQTVVRGMVQAGCGGSIVNIGSMWAHQAIGATPRRVTRRSRAGRTR